MEDTTQAGMPAAEASEDISAGTAPEATAAETTPEADSTQATPDGIVSTETNASEEVPANETPETKSRRERQAERRKQATPPPAAPPPVQTPEQIIAEYQRQQQAHAEVQQRQQAEHQRRARYIGEVPADPNNPQGPTVYQQLLAKANAHIPDGDDQFYTEETRALVRERNEARAKLEEYDGRRGLIQSEAAPIQQAAQTQALNWMGNQFERGLADVGVDVQAVLSAGANVDPGERMPTIIKALAAQIVAPLKAENEELRDDLAAQKEETDSWRRRAGGAADQVLRGGTAANGTGGSVVQRLIQQAGSPEAFAERAERGEYAHIDLTK